jgi:hypothetical protein
VLAVFLANLIVAVPGPAPPPSAADAGWTERKCQLYGRAWDYAAQGDALQGVSRDFIGAHEAFIASGCLEGKICPGNDAARALADTLSLMAVAEGMTGSFLPFVCPDQ